MFDLHSRRAIHLCRTSRLLKSLNDPAKVEKAVRQILPELGSLVFEIGTDRALSGTKSGVGHELVPEQMASVFEKDWRDEVRSSLG